MIVLIDADGCPVVDITLGICKEQGTACLILCDTAHEFSRDGAETLVFDKGSDSVDFAIASRVSPGDLVVTQDYGLASVCLARRGRVIHPDGWEYTQDNIVGLLTFRHEARKHRAAGGRCKGPKKRTKQQDEAFQAGLRKLLQTAVQG